MAWHKTERLALNVGLHYEGFKVDDWALQGVAPDTLPVVLTLGAQPYDYDVMLVGIGFTYQVGGSQGNEAD
jgi:hypothetical protein